MSLRNPTFKDYLAMFALSVLVVAMAFMCTKDILSSAISAQFSHVLVVMDMTDPNVHNGSVTESYVIDAQNCRSVVVPTKATVIPTGPGNKIEIIAEKCLGFCGHPGTKMTAESTATQMSCLYKVYGSSLLIGLSGEWDSHIEGGAWINLTCKVPTNISVTKSDQLKGSDPTGMDDKDHWREPLGGGWTKLTNPISKIVKYNRV